MSDLWTAWKLFPLDENQTSHSKDSESDTFRWPVMGRYWVIELLYNSVKTGSLFFFFFFFFGDQTRWWQDAVEKACTQQSRPPGLQLSNPGERERHNADVHKSGGQYVAVLFGLQFPLTVKPWVTPFEPFQIKWEVYFSKRLCRSSLLWRYDSACICRCRCIMCVA